MIDRRLSCAGLAGLARTLALGIGLALTPFAGLPDASGRFAVALADDDGGGDDGGGGGGGGGGSGGSGGGGAGGGSSERSSSGRHIRSFNLFGLFGIGQGSPRREQRVAHPDRRRAAQAVPREIVAAGLTEADIARLREEGFRLVAQRSLGLVGNLTVRLRVPRRLSTARAVERVRTLFPAALVDLNHLYRGVAAPCPDTRCFSLLAPEARIAGACVARGTIGMVDTAVDLAHPALAGKSILAESVREASYRPAGDAHGTDVAILLTRGAAGGDGARIVAVDAFHRRGGSANADSFDLVAALDLLAGRQVQIVNLSLAGPANALVERLGSLMHERGAVLVAAAGNDGPGAAPLYPAAYPWAVAVTAIDRDGKVYARANRGDYLAFAAPGVRIQLPDKAMRPGPPRSGTSYAAPLVTLAFAHRRMQDEKAMPQALLASLSAEARDLGAPGRDPVFGWGSLSCPQ